MEENVGIQEKECEKEDLCHTSKLKKIRLSGFFSSNISKSYQWEKIITEGIYVGR